MGGDRADLEDAYGLHSARFSDVMREEGWDKARANRDRFGPQRTGLETGSSGTIARNDAIRHVPTSEFLLNRLSQNRSFRGIGGALEDLPEAVHEQELSALTGIQPKLANGNPNPLYNIADMQHEYVKGAINKGLVDEWLDPATGQSRLDPATGQPLSRTINAGTPNERTFTLKSEFDRWNASNRGTITGAKLEHPVDNLVHWINGLPAKTVENGVYDQTLAKDAADYVGDLASRTATLKSAHDFLARDNVVGTAIKNGVPLRDAWAQGWNEKTLTGLNPKGLEGFVMSKYANQVGAEESQLQQALKSHPMYQNATPEAIMQGEAKAHQEASRQRDRQPARSTHAPFRA